MAKAKDVKDAKADDNLLVTEEQMDAHQKKLMENRQKK